MSEKREGEEGKMKEKKKRKSRGRRIRGGRVIWKEQGGGKKDIERKDGVKGEKKSKRKEE